ncbi:MAG: hypothetical protein KatS3mg129_2037 [Leptospiraceae bacterium]|nr:MAG: hypothetical protein KatS3mg129_2037 [Leptospiraceae bacterium]
MSKRIWQNKFRFYVRLGAIPFLLIGLIGIFYPDLFFQYIILKDFSKNIINIFFLRFMGILFVFIYFTFEYMASNPNYHRDLAFYQFLLIIGISILTILAVFLWKFSYYLLIISIYGIIYGIFLLMFASKNLLVRD